MKWLQVSFISYLSTEQEEKQPSRDSVPPARLSLLQQSPCLLLAKTKRTGLQTIFIFWGVGVLLYVCLFIALLSPQSDYYHYGEINNLILNKLRSSRA